MGRRRGTGLPDRYPGLPEAGPGLVAVPQERPARLLRRRPAEGRPARARRHRSQGSPEPFRGWRELHPRGRCEHPAARPTDPRRPFHLCAHLDAMDRRRQRALPGPRPAALGKRCAWQHDPEPGHPQPGPLPATLLARQWPRRRRRDDRQGPRTAHRHLVHDLSARFARLGIPRRCDRARPGQWRRPRPRHDLPRWRRAGVLGAVCELPAR